MNLFLSPNIETESSKGGYDNGRSSNNPNSNGHFNRGGFRASAGSRYSDWMGGAVGSSKHSQVSSFAPISTLSSKTTTSCHSSQQPSSKVNGGNQTISIEEKSALI